MVSMHVPEAICSVNVVHEETERGFGEWLSLPSLDYLQRTQNSNLGRFKLFLRCTFFFSIYFALRIYLVSNVVVASGGLMKPCIMPG